MSNEFDDKLEQRIRFVAKHYAEGRLDADRAWQRFAAEHKVVRRSFLRRYWMGQQLCSYYSSGLEHSF